MTRLEEYNVSKQPKDDKETEQRRDRQNAIRERIDDIFNENPDGTVADLFNLAIQLASERHPAKLSQADKQKIQGNYPDATPSLIQERALSDEGFMLVMGAAQLTARIAVDYKPESFCNDLMEADDEHAAAGQALAATLEQAYAQATESGFSAFGASSMMILLGTVLGLKKGLRLPQIARPLLDALSHATSNSGPISAAAEAAAEEFAVKAVAQAMGISVAEARKYAAHVKSKKGGE
jgi:hypothetical protein